VSDRDDDSDSEDANLYTVDSDGSDEKQITDGDAEDLDPDWKPQ
jgi:Tol biopolymer transport system component